MHTSDISIILIAEQIGNVVIIKSRRIPHTSENLIRSLKVEIDKGAALGTVLSGVGQNNVFVSTLLYSTVRPAISIHNTV